MPSLDHIPKAVQCGVADTLSVVVRASFVLLLVTGVSVGGQFLFVRYGFVPHEQLATDLRDPRTITLVIAIGVELWYFAAALRAELPRLRITTNASVPRALVCRAPSSTGRWPAPLFRRSSCHRSH